MKNVLILCTGNSARSILGEALVNHLGGGRLRGFSAGSQPKEQPHRLALEILAAHGLPAEGYRSKSWDEFAAAGAPKLDLIITVCDSAAGEACPPRRAAAPRASRAGWGGPPPPQATGACPIPPPPPAQRPSGAPPSRPPIASWPSASPAWPRSISTP